jgi:hypothetical protein
MDEDRSLVDRARAGDTQAFEERQEAIFGRRPPENFGLASRRRVTKQHLTQPGDLEPQGPGPTRDHGPVLGR